MFEIAGFEHLTRNRTERDLRALHDGKHTAHRWDYTEPALGEKLPKKVSRVLLTNTSGSRDGHTSSHLDMVKVMTTALETDQFVGRILEVEYIGPVSQEEQALYEQVCLGALSRIKQPTCVSLVLDDRKEIL